jgi:hypothetical protein
MALQNAMPKGLNNRESRDAALRGYLTAGQGVMRENLNMNTSNHPALRSSYALLVSTDVSSLRSLDPESGAYLNEV